MRFAASLLVSGLLTACSSQIVVIPGAPLEGASTSVNVQSEKGDYTLNEQGYGFYTGFVPNTRYRVDEADLKRDFGPSIDSMQEIIAAGLPEIPHSYVVLLHHNSGPLGSLLFDSADGSIHHQLDQPAQAAFIDGYPDKPKPVDGSQLQRDFGPALAALRDTLKTQRSYLMLLESPDGSASKVLFHARQGATLLENVGESITLDGLPHDAEQTLAETDFGASKEATKKILDDGLPKLSHSYAAIMESPLGPIGEAEILEGQAMGVILDQPGQAVIIDGYSNKIFTLDEAQYQRDFGASAEAMPPLPVTLTLYFKSGSAKLTKDTLAIMQVILEEIRKRPAADITISGFTDTVKNDQYNNQLSLQRSEAVAALIRKSGVPLQEISIAAYGKDLLAIQTPDNTAEEMNRRVEISIR